LQKGRKNRRAVVIEEVFGFLKSIGDRNFVDVIALKFGRFEGLGLESAEDSD
jgi:hypothetical protein